LGAVWLHDLTCRMPKRVLIVTNRADLHADIVSAKLAAMGGAPFRLNLDDFPKHFSLNLEFTHGRWGGELVYLPSGDTLSVGDIGAVWMRKKARFSFLSEDLAPQEQAYAEGEMEHVLFSVLYSLDCYWMSHPAALRGASWKGEQLLRAARLGFRVPPSLVTSRRDGVDAFRAKMGGDIVFKSLSSPSLAAEAVSPEERIAGALPTTRITDEHEAALDAVVELPCFFQQYVPKRYELRVTVIGNRVFAARIDSQEDARTVVDYRDFSAEIRYTAERLPPEIEHRCLELVRSYGLNYGAIDLIVTPGGEYVFLENNPAGQFLFIEELVPELNMTGALAECLLEGAKARERVT
jgi:glutathione synthase/RimK-type ligase-like ATP-grasp enzyme